MRAVFAALVSLAGCADLSGLDGLDVCDGACADVTIADVASTQESSTVDAGVDAADGSAIVDAPSDVGNAKDATSDTSAQLPCTKPSDCSNNQVCCETLQTKGNQFPNCIVDADTVACTAASACTTTVGFTCGKDILRRCNAAQECTEQNATKCCTFKLGDSGTREVCMDSVTASVLNATCL